MQAGFLDAVISVSWMTGVAFQRVLGSAGSEAPVALSFQPPAEPVSLG
jgi:hypothetical protein